MLGGKKIGPQRRDWMHCPREVNDSRLSMANTSTRWYSCRSSMTYRKRLIVWDDEMSKTWSSNPVVQIGIGTAICIMDAEFLIRITRWWYMTWRRSYSILDVRGMRWTAHWIHFPAIAEAIWIAYQANQGWWYTTYRYFISQVSSLIWSWWAPFWGCILSDLVHWAAMSSLYIRYSISFDELMQITDIKLLSAAPCLTLGLDVS